MTKKRPWPAVEEEDRQEAAALAVLPRPLQRAILEAVGKPANDTRVPEEERQAQQRRAAALAKLLGLDVEKC